MFNFKQTINNFQVVVLFLIVQLFYCSLLKFTVYCLLFTVYRLPFTVYRLPFTVYRLPCFCTFFIVRLYPHTYNTYIIYLFLLSPPFFYCFVKDLLLLHHCSVLDRKQQVFELCVRKFLVFIAAKLVGITIRKEVNGITWLELYFLFGKW